MLNVGHWKATRLSEHALAFELHGHVDRMSILAFERALTAVEREQPALLVVDLRNAVYVDDAILTVVLGVAMRLRARGAVLSVAAVHGELRERIADRSLTHYLRVRSTAQEALRTLGSSLEEVSPVRGALTRWVTERRLFPRTSAEQPSDVPREPPARPLDPRHNRQRR